MMRFFKTAGIFIFSSLILSGCFPSIGGGTAPHDVEEFVKGGIVQGFPLALPYYQNAKIIESYGRSGNYGATFVTDDDLAKVVNFYQDAFEKLGWDVTVSGSGTNFVFDIKNTTNAGSVIINTASDNRRTTITYSIAPR